MTQHLRTAVGLATSALVMALPAHGATTQTYNNLAVFQSATGATAATGALPSPGGFGSSSASVASATVGSVTFAAPSFLFTDWTTALPGAELAVSSGAGNVGAPFFNDGIDASFSGLVYSAGFAFYEPTATTTFNGCNVSPCVNSQFQVQLKNGASVVATHAWTPLKDQVEFFGVWSDTPFNKLEIRETVGTDDNEFYGQFYSGVTAVPEPGTAALWLLGLWAVGAAGARRRG